MPQGQGMDSSEQVPYQSKTPPNPLLQPTGRKRPAAD